MGLAWQRLSSLVRLVRRYWLAVGFPLVGCEYQVNLIIVLSVLVRILLDRLLGEISLRSFFDV